MTESYSLYMSLTFKQDLSKLAKENKKRYYSKVMDFLVEMSANPYEGSGKPEELKGDLSDCWSRRIDQKHRLVYQVDEEERKVYLLSAYGHYGDK